MQEIKLYSPIKITTYEDDNPYPSAINGVPYADKIAETIELADTSAGDRGLMAFFDKNRSPEINEKIYSIHYSLTEKENELYCVTTIGLMGDKSLNNIEMNRAKDYITGQFSDGVGEILEQTTIFTDDCELHAHLWQDSDWKLISQSEFDEKNYSKVHKPDAPMIGADGNIFNQLSIAKKVLIENGQDYVVKEMISRVMDCESYESALSVICEYVTPINKDTLAKEKGKSNDKRER